MAIHALFGAVAALPSGNRTLIAIGAIAVIAIDFDHVIAFTGLEFASRTGHSPFFMVLASLVVWQVTKSGILKGGVSPLGLAGVAAASVPAHMAVDVISLGGDMPLMAPFSYSTVFLPSWTTWILQGGV